VPRARHELGLRANLLLGSLAEIGITRDGPGGTAIRGLAELRKIKCWCETSETSVDLTHILPKLTCDSS
jgi:hypothetical protein